MNQVPRVQTSSLLQRLRWIGDPVGYMESAAQVNPDIFATRVIGFGNNVVFVNHPKAIQQILTQDTKQFSAPGEWNRILQPVIGDYSIIMSSGDRHRRQRQLLMPPFHGEHVKSYSQVICDITTKAMNKLPMGQVFPVRSVMQEISLEVICQTVFGLYSGDRYEQLKQRLRSLLDIFSSPLAASLLFFPVLQRDFGPWSPGHSFQRQRQEIDQLIYAEIRDRRTQTQAERTDILSLLLTATDEAGVPLSDQELRDELITLLMAGHETTATALSWALYWTHFLPQVGATLRQELKEQGNLDDPLSFNKLPYLTAVCQETLRIYPVAMLTFPRAAQVPVEILGYPLEPGTAVIGCIYLLHQRPDLYPEPQQFRPERFLERQYSPYEFLPFGGGVRRCIGAALAQLELKLVLATILSHYSLELIPTPPLRPQRRGVTLGPSNALKMQLV